MDSSWMIPAYSGEAEPMIFQLNSTHGFGKEDGAGPHHLSWRSQDTVLSGKVFPPFCFAPVSAIREVVLEATCRKTVNTYL